MKKILYAAVAALALSAGTATAALAADVIAEQPPAPAPVSAMLSTAGWSTAPAA
jgi:hypothetical protein